MTKGNITREALDDAIGVLAGPAIECVALRFPEMDPDEAIDLIHQELGQFIADPDVGERLDAGQLSGSMAVAELIGRCFDRIMGRTA